MDMPREIWVESAVEEGFDDLYVATEKEYPDDTPYILKSEYEELLKRNFTLKAELERTQEERAKLENWTTRSQKLRTERERNLEFCVCKFDESGEVVSACAAHQEWQQRKYAKLVEAVRKDQHRNGYWGALANCDKALADIEAQEKDDD